MKYDLLIMSMWLNENMMTMPTALRSKKDISTIKAFQVFLNHVIVFCEQ